MFRFPPLLQFFPDSELRFQGPFKEPVSVVLMLTNNEEKHVLYKIKVTEPALYHVSPFQGIVGPKEDVTIQVTLMPFDPNVKRKEHKFKIFSVLAPEGKFNIDTFISLNPWKETSQSEIHEWKLLRVVLFEAAEDEGSSAGTPAESENSSAVASVTPEPPAAAQLLY